MTKRQGDITRTFICFITAFIMAMGVTAGSLSALRIIDEEQKRPSPSQIAQDENYWLSIQTAFDIDRDIVNLNNGGVHPAPRTAMNALHRYLDFANGAPTYNSWIFIRPRKEFVRKGIADTFGCSPEEIAITRNVTEALEIPLFGLELKPGDEVLTTTHDYPSMKNTLLQREKREGIVVKTFSFPYPPKSLQELADLFEKNVTPRTKLILVCHITSTTGQIFPVKEICRMARQKGIEVIVDGAHAFGQFEFKLKDLDCDIYGANLHKWMMAPIGSGFLYVKKEKIKKIWPLFAAPDPLSDDIRKFENYGTHPEPIWAAAAEALSFHHGIGAKVKEERLRFLKNYWASALKDLPGVRILTSFDPLMSCGVGTFTIENMDMAELTRVLLEKNKIVLATFKLPDGVGVIRVTPSIYTTLGELDLFIQAVASYIIKGLPNEKPLRS